MNPNSNNTNQSNSQNSMQGPQAASKRDVVEAEKRADHAEAMASDAKRTAEDHVKATNKEILSAIEELEEAIRDHQEALESHDESLEYLLENAQHRKLGWSFSREDDDPAPGAIERAREKLEESDRVEAARERLGGLLSRVHGGTDGTEGNSGA